MAKLKAAILISGRGSNMGALGRATLDPDFPVEIVMVVSNKPDVEGIDLALDLGLPYRVVDQSGFESREEHESAITEVLKEAGAELVCLAGYMRILTNRFLDAWRGKVINIHPSLLPALRGVDTHARALEHGVRVHGCTVHFVSPELDAGPIIAQATVPVLPGDTEDALSARVLQVEHELYPKALALVAERRVRWSGSGGLNDVDVTIDDVFISAGAPSLNPAD